MEKLGQERSYLLRVSIMMAIEEIDHLLHKTVLLDEINSMSLGLQAKLLRVIQEGYVRRIGGIKDIPIDVKIIATTNEEPLKSIENGTLRKDLYYRLNVIYIKIPPLRERKDD